MSLAVEALLQAQIAFLDSQRTRPGHRPDALSVLAGGGGDALLAGMKGAAAMEILEREFSEDLRVRSHAIRSNASTAVEAHGETSTPQPFLTFLTRYMPWGRAPRSVIYMGFGKAHALDQLSSGHGEMAEGTLCSLMAALELAVLDNSRWDMPLMM